MYRKYYTRLFRILIFIYFFTNLTYKTYYPYITACPSPSFGNRINLGLVQHNQLIETSGIDASNKNYNVLWLHNDGGTPTNCLYAMNTSGRHLGRYFIHGIVNRDWEDIAVGYGPVPNQQYIYIGEFGDNNSQYNLKYIYRILEPDVSEYQDSVNITLYGVETIIFQYPDGNRDAETLLIDPLTKDLYVITKRESNVRVYRAPYPQPINQTITLQHVHTLSLTQVTGGDISNSGLEILIKTYNNVYYWCRTAQQTVWEAFNNTRHTLPYIPEPQGEAICWKPDSMGYYTVSEEPPPNYPPAHLYFYPRLITGMHEENLLPVEFVLYQNYPNPFNPLTKIRFSLPRTSQVKVTVYDALGREVATAVKEQLNPGTYEVDFDGTGYPSGVYFFRLTADGKYIDSRKMMIAK